MTGTPQPGQGGSDAGAVTVTELGGDSACWAHRVCEQCGRLNEAERPEVCVACGAAFEELDG